MGADRIDLGVSDQGEVLVIVLPTPGTTVSLRMDADSAAKLGSALLATAKDARERLANGRKKTDDLIRPGPDGVNGLGVH